MLGEHHYAVELEWQGDRGEGTSGYRAYGRQHVVRAAGKLHDIAGSSDRVFHGDRERWNPEELLLAALSECHMLSYLHVATRHGVIVRGYTDAATGHDDRGRPGRRRVQRGDPASARRRRGCVDARARRPRSTPRPPRSASSRHPSPSRCTTTGRRPSSPAEPSARHGGRGQRRLDRAGTGVRRRAASTAGRTRAAARPRGRRTSGARCARS